MARILLPLNNAQQLLHAIKLGLVHPTKPTHPLLPLPVVVEQLLPNSLMDLLQPKPKSFLR